MIAKLANKLKNEYLIVHTKVPPMGGVYPRGVCVYVDDENIVLQERADKQMQIADTEKFSKPFYVVPIEEIRGIAGIDPEQLTQVEEAQDLIPDEAPVSTGSPAVIPEAADDFQDVDFDDQLPQSYIERHLK